ncbi:heterokaryon incompatibility protein-domain-containing protein [Paraphoma chrysanthemicola]|uniref:Heterokaryon incompatibility protein-domain-containing protein n=1 Tax=Paraphoma chrysanthemicola TaxID=798071 RepID=A0A8K0QVY9_9PLEO|nr:heterokaryon incompatibility protein-domain-containing protein [Paraphoma chrysanthemicola]
MSLLSETNVQFTHMPLDDSEQQFRLLKLHPGSSNSPIDCDLEAYRIENAPVYIGISYMWGPVTPSHTIRLNGMICTVRDNLFNFLLHFRNDTANTKYLWIDYICIDQSSTQERNHQVRLMSRIYRTCVIVVAWLGCDEYEVMAAKQYATSGRTDYLQLLFFNLYFERIWIVQEILLAREVWLLCGRVWVHESPMCDLAMTISLHCVPKSTAYLFRDRRFGSATIKERDGGDDVAGQMPRRKVKEFSLTSCMIRYNSNKCADPRDTIYGLLSLVSFTRIEADYSKNYDALAYEVMLEVAEEFGQRCTPALSTARAFVFIAHKVFGHRAMVDGYPSRAWVASVLEQSWKELLTPALIEAMIQERIKEGVA